MQKQGNNAWNLWVGITFITLSIAGIILVPYQVLEPNIGIRSIAFSPSTFPYLDLSLVTLFSIMMMMASAQVGTPNPAGEQPIITSSQWNTLANPIRKSSKPAQVLLALAPKWSFDRTVEETLDWYRNVARGADPFTNCETQISAFKMSA
jgi:hypothetical protein